MSRNLICPECRQPDGYFYITQSITLRYDVTGDLAEDYDCRDLEVACALGDMDPYHECECFECGFIGPLKAFESSPND